MKTNLQVVECAASFEGEHNQRQILLHIQKLRPNIVWTGIVQTPATCYSMTQEVVGLLAVQSDTVITEGICS